MRALLRQNVEAHHFDGEALERMQRDQWGEGEAPRMTRLVLSFPTLEDADGVQPWNPDSLISWACGQNLDEDGIHALRFVLQVWSPTTDWRAMATSVLLRSGRSILEALNIAATFAPFNVVSALGSWDDAHQAVFLTWVGVPFYP
jgi:hypothetical protein